MPPPTESNDPVITFVDERERPTPPDGVPEAGPPPPEAPAWFREGFVYLSDQIAATDDVGRQCLDAVREQGVAIRQLQAEVFGGSKPPPPFISQRPPAARGTSQPPAFMRPVLAKRVTQSEASVELLAQEVSNLRSELAESRSELATTRVELGSVKSMTQQQTRGMGMVPTPVSHEGEPQRKPSVAKKTATFVFSVPGLIALTSLIAALTGLVAAVRGAPSPPPPASYAHQPPAPAP